MGRNRVGCVSHAFVADPILVWDTTTVRNGTYFVKVVASDAPSNPLGTALTGEMSSAAFDIDNTPPTILIHNVRTEGGRTIISFEVKDDHSPIQRADYSMDGLRWRGVFPVDGIADSKDERYELTIDGERYKGASKAKTARRCSTS